MITAVMCVCFSGVPAADSQERPARPPAPSAGVAGAERFWEELKAITPERLAETDGEEFVTKAGVMGGDFQAAYGYGLLSVAVDRLPPGDERAVEEFAEALAAKFARGSDLDDARWFFALEKYVSNGKRRYPLRTDDEDAWFKLKMAFARSLSKRFVEDRPALERYQYLLAWRSLWMGGKDQTYGSLAPVVKYGLLVTGRIEEGSPTYWWDVRDFIVTAHATGRPDLIPKTADDLSKTPELAGRWRRWIYKEGPYLRPEEKSPTWRADTDVAGRKPYGRFFLNDYELPPLTNDPADPFPGWKYGKIPVHFGTGY